MRRLIASLATVLALLAWHGNAHAACTTSTIMLPDGRAMFCMTCCTGMFCNTTCS
jgi:hypothetical protein